MVVQKITHSYGKENYSFLTLSFLKGVKKLSDLASTVDSSRATYKKILKEGKLPCIPAFKFELEVFHKCRDIPSEVAGPDEQMLINFEKYRFSFFSFLLFFFDSKESGKK